MYNKAIAPDFGCFVRLYNPIRLRIGFFMNKKHKSEIMNAQEVIRALKRIAHQIAEKNDGVENVILMGIANGGIPIAKELGAFLYAFEGTEVPCGTLDISAHRDDRKGHGFVEKETVPTEMPCDIDGKDVVLVDDVLYTGRTARAAFDALSDYGRAGTIQLAVLVDRGHRELPIRADYVGKNVPTSHTEMVGVDPCDEGFTVNIYNVIE